MDVKTSFLYFSRYKFIKIFFSIKKYASLVIIHTVKVDASKKMFFDGCHDFSSSDNQK